MPSGSRRGDNGGEPIGEPEYGWLYGGDRAASATTRDPEPTRVMAATPRSRTRSESESPSESPSQPPSQSPSQSPSQPRRPAPARPRRRRLRPFLVLVALWLAFMVAVPLWAWSEIDKVDIDQGARPADQPGTTYLLVGSDSRAGLSQEQRRKLGTGGAVGQRTDTIMMLHTGSGPSLLMSVPRDSLVPIPGHGTNKINAAFAYGGPKLLVKTLEKNTGVKIDHYVEIGFGGFVRAIDAVGGIQICPKQDVKDKDAHIDIKKGCQEADGATALGYSRSRHAFKALGDVQRAANQRSVINSVGDKIKSPMTILNPVRYFRINNAMTESVKISEGTGPIALANFAFAMTRVNGTNGLTCGIPISDLAVHWDKERALSMLRFIKQDKIADMPKSLCSESGLRK